MALLRVLAAKAVLAILSLLYSEPLLIMDSHQGQTNPSDGASSGFNKVLREGKSETLNKAKETLKRRMLQSIMQQTMEELQDAERVADDLITEMEDHHETLANIKAAVKARLLEQIMQQALAEIDEEVVASDGDVLDPDDLAFAVEEELAAMGEDLAFESEEDHTSPEHHTEDIWHDDEGEGGADWDSEEGHDETHAELMQEPDDAVGSEQLYEEDAREQNDDGPYHAEEPGRADGTVFFAQPVEDEPDASAGDSITSTNQDFDVSEPSIDADNELYRDESSFFEEDVAEERPEPDASEEETVIFDASELHDEDTDDTIFSSIEGDGSLSWLVEDVKEQDLSYESYSPNYDTDDGPDGEDEAASETFYTDEFAPEVVLDDLDTTREGDETSTWEVIQFEGGEEVRDLGDGATGLYVYGILGSNLDEARMHLPGEGIDPAYPVEIVSQGALHAVVSQVPLATFGETALQENLRNEHWIASHVRHHESLLEHLMQHVSLLPMRFCTIYADADRVKEMLELRGAQLEDTLNRLQGSQEWGVRIYSDVEQLRRRVVEDSERVRALLSDMKSKPRGVAHFIKKQMVVAIHEEVEALTEACTQETQESLDALSEDSALQELFTPDAEDRQGAMIANAAYLVQRSDEEDFKNEIERLRSKYTDFGFDFERTGPWPPYSFAQTHLAAEAG